ncbi:CDGSH iron-sulfur domain-containing protein [Nocardioides sp. JQ2195]|uniref:CDGSH iron-sulfur domain-containing protein n=1 Tax=Nocardioides sp. JQ2195 TaxID=2592334 RepID=UPI00143EE7C5|nr:CDGSH iron-sulfur domain-containing protein [Nocardioides sp. JQ2195]QIX27113.1 CDGSH iron-sulfur domain-containing protein [Nocardioides sp. JQ2195]
MRTQDCPGGPLLVRGAASWVGQDGEEHPVTRPVVAVCRCERSQRQPWCDGTHKFVTPRASAQTSS